MHLYRACLSNSRLAEKPMLHQDKVSIAHLQLHLQVSVYDGKQLDMLSRRHTQTPAIALS